MQRIELDPSVGLPANGIVRADLLALLHDAHAIRQSAHTSADAVIADAHEQASHIASQARQAGYAEGFAAFSDAIARLDFEREKLRERVSGLVRECLERFLGQVPKEDLLGVVLGSVLGELPKEQAVTIMVHPANIPAIEAAVHAYRARLSQGVPIRYEPGNALSVDECLIYTGPEVVDASVSVIAEEMVNALCGTFEREAADGF